jgi:RHS repeat-associated protein
MQRSDSRYYLATDQVGTPRAVIDDSGTIVKALSHDSFGELASDSSPSFELPFGFAGGLDDSVTGLTRFGLRDYEAASGRWTARDPALLGGGQTNLYAYAGNQPVALHDPSGLVSVGGSAYVGVGAGAKLGITGSGISVCVETGLGIGTDLELEGSDKLDPEGTSVEAEAKFTLGPLEGKASAELSGDRGLCTNAKVKLSLPDGRGLTFTKDGVTAGYDHGVKVNGARSNIAKSAKAGMQAKVVARRCWTARW